MKNKQTIEKKLKLNDKYIYMTKYMSKIYVLLCEGNRYYIGKTERNIEERIEEHFRANGSYWTKKYKPLKVVETIQSNDKMDEDKYTKKYMLLYGVDKVRGGSYTEIVLPEYKLKCLQDELCTINDLCFKCKRKGHFANQCYAKTTIYGDLIESEDDVWCCDYCVEVFNSESEAEIHEESCFENFCKRNDLCLRCMRSGHFANKCYAKTTVDGNLIESETDTDTDSEIENCDRCGRNGHSIDDCYAKKTVDGMSTDVVDVVNVVVDVGKAVSWLWGEMRSGHFANKCYAKTTVYGNLIESDTYTESEAERHCGRCGRLKGRNGHSIDDCGGWNVAS